MKIALLSAGAAAIVASIAVWNIQNWRYGEKIQEARAEQSEAARKAMEAMQREYEADIARKDKAIHEATLRAQKNQALARALDANVNSVRIELNTARADLSKASADAVRKYSDAQSIVVRACTARLVEVGVAATQCASDIRLMQEAWPD